MNKNPRAKLRGFKPNRTNRRPTSPRAAGANFPMVHRRVEESDAEAHRLLKLAMSSARMVAWTWDPRSNTITTSANFSEIYGLSAIKSATQVMALLHPDDRSRHLKTFAEANQRSQPYHSVFRIIRPDTGRIVWLEEHAAPVPDRTGRLLAFSGIVMDITARKEIEATLRESELRFRQVTDAIEQVFLMTDVARRQMLYISPGYERIWARTCTSLYSSPRSWFEAIHPADRARVRAVVRARQDTGDHDLEFRIIRPDGTERWIHERAFPIRDGAGKVYRIAGIADDITERKRDELEREKLVRLIEHSGDFISTADLDGRITYMNAAGHRMIGLREDQDPGALHFTDYVAPGWIEFFRGTVLNSTGAQGTALHSNGRRAVRLFSD